MLKFFYKLKKKNGMVLFFVVAMMAILIIMSTAAYYTARSSYNTVVSNYDFEQMYLSATAISDLILDSINIKNSVIVETTGEGASIGKDKDINRIGIITDETTGFLSKMRGDVFGVEIGSDDSFPDTIEFSSTDKITIYTNNIKTFADNGGNINDKDAVAKYAISNPLDGMEGILDGAYVEIKLDKAVGRGTVSTTSIDSTTAKRSRSYDCKYIITTTAFYRDNYFIVEDIVYEKGVTISKNFSQSSSGGGGGGGGAPGTYFTATGQTILDDGTFGDQTRSVVIKAHEISDNAYFENNYTFFVNGNNNEFKGGIRTSGSLILDKFTTNIPAPNGEERHDWIINGDLIITDSNANSLNLNGNNLYVKGNIIIMTQGFNLSAANVYCGESFYDLAGGSSAVNGNLFVGKNIEYKATDEITNSAGTGIIDVVRNQFANSGSTASFSGGNTNNTPNGLSVNGTTKVNGSINNNSQQSAPTSVGSWNKENEMTDVTKPGGENGEKYTVSGLHDTANKNEDPWGNSDVREETLNNKLTIDIKDESGLRNTPNVTISDIEDGYDDQGNPIVVGQQYDYKLDDGTVVHAEKLYSSNTYDYTFTPSGGGTAATASYSTDTNVGLNVDIPFNSKGYNLQINYGDKVDDSGNVITENVKVKDGYWDSVRNVWVPDVWEQQPAKVGNGGNVNFNFGTKESEYSADGKTLTTNNTMSVMLRANIKDGTGTATDENGNNAFAWKGGKYNSNGSTSKVQLVGTDADGKAAKNTEAKGNVLFIMGDYDKTTGKYRTYDANDFDKIASTTYYTGEKETVGTYKQVEKVSGNWQNDSTIRQMFQTGTSIPKAEYDNRLIIASNKVNGTAINGARLDNTICGYVYAPNSGYDTQNINGGNTPIFGGMIVSTYTADLSKWLYAEPNKEIADELFRKLLKDTSYMGPITTTVGNVIPNTLSVAGSSNGVSTQYGKNYIA